MLLIAIDPGANGGIAVVSTTDNRPVVMKMPDTPKDIYDLFFGLNTVHGFPRLEIHAIVEKVGMHRQGNNASASCKFARHCGHIEMALIALGIPFEEVGAAQWMKVCGTLPTGSTPKDKTKRKNAIKDFVQRRYPSIKCTLWAADALGILTYQLERAK